MQEFMSEAVVLAHEPYGELDKRYALFTKHFGKLIAKAKSSRKITSKLSGHLEPGNIANVRLVHQGTLHLVDALKHERLSITPGDLHMLNELLSEGEEDRGLWELLRNDRFSWRETLAILGWDPMHATCSECGAKTITAFYIKDHDFFCTLCASKLPSNTVILV